MQGAEEGRALDPASATSSDASFDVAEPRPPDGFRWIRRDPMLVVEVGLVVLLVVLAWRLQWIADDGYIYLTHVQNWVENGAGPNLNVGERVEGYTSVGWFVLLSIGDLLRPHGLLSLEQLTILVGLVLTAAAAVCWIGIERTAIATTETTVGPDEADRAPRSRTVANLPLVLFVTSYVVRSYATSGLETPLIMLWATAAVWVIWARRRPLVVAALLAGVGPLVRPELALVSVVLVAIVILEIRARRGTDPVGSRTIAALVALVVLPAVVSEVVRIAYYGQLLPNTYYVKTGTSHGWADGWRYLVDAAGPHRWWWILAVSAVLATCVPIARWWRGRSATSTTLVVTAADCRRWLLLGSAVALALAAMRNGGDFMHGRTLLPAFVMLLGSLSGAASVALDRVRQQPARLVGAVAIVVVLVAVQLPLTSRQQSSGNLIIGDIADELRFYEFRDANVHTFGGENLDPLAAMGRDLAALADRLDTEIGFTAGAIGMTSYFGQRDGGRVYLYDVHGLTRPDVARVEVAADTRVGHSRRATEPMVVLDERVDFSSLTFDGYDEAFSVPVGSSTFVLVSFDLIEPLRAEGLIDDAAVERMTDYLTTQLAGDDVDPDLVQFLLWRPFPDPAITARVAELADVLPPSPWLVWAEATDDERTALASTSCGGFFDCLGRAIDAHRADEIPFLPPGALPPPG